MKFLQEELTFSERRACRAIEIDRKSLHYEAVEKDSQILTRQVRAIAEKYPSFGYRRVHEALKRQGVQMNLKRLRRIYLDLRLNLRRQKRRRYKFEGVRRPARVLDAPNKLWCMDFMFDKTQSGNRIMILTILDEFSRFCPGIFVRTGFKFSDMKYALDAAFEACGAPAGIISDNGLEFTHPVFRSWAKKKGIDLFNIRPGKPIENAIIESFNGRVRDECLRRNAFESLDEAAELLEEWRKFYNEERPHSGIGNLTPIEFMKQWK